LPAWLFDPQTSGGLLAGVKSDRLQETLNQLRAAGYSAHAIGEVVPLEDGQVLCRIQE
jgi:selenide,water dikinase